MMFTSLLCLLLFRVNGLNEEICKQGPTEQDAKCDLRREKRESENVDEDKMELLQRDLQLKSQEGIETVSPPYKEVTMTPWPCMQTNLSFQSTTPEGNKKSIITKWNIATGGYEPVLTLYPEWTDPPFRSLNACGINPINSILYCSLVINNRGTFLVAIDKEKVGYVDKVLGFRYSATFDADDNYYVYGKDYILAVIKGVSKKKVWSSWSGLDANLKEKTGEQPVAVKVDGAMTKNPHMGADLAYFEYDLRGKGKEKFLASLTASMMKLLCISCEPYELFTLHIKCESLPPFPSGKPRVWGTAWAYRGSTAVYFSADDGAGLYATTAEGIDWKNKDAYLSYAGKAIKTDWNDGLSCGSDPWQKKDVEECTYMMYRSTTAGRWTDNPESYIAVMDPKTGANIKDKGWKVNAWSLNACAINPIDNKIYCTVHTTKYDATLARLDSKGNIGYLVNYPPYAKAGTFDEKGNYWIFGGNPGLLKMEGINFKTAFKDPKSLGSGFYPPNAINPVFGENMKKQTIGDRKKEGLSNNMIGADMEVLELDERYYLISLPGTEGDYPYTDFMNRMSFLDITDGEPQEPVILWDKTNSLPKPLKETPKGQTPGSMTWGSSWRIPKGKEFIYLFASDDGQGIFQLLTETINFKDKSVKFAKYGEADPIEWNNGFSCYKKDPNELALK